jgi:hypothetical protein
MVLRALPEGQTLVNFGGQHVVLELGHALTRGQTFLATVEQITPNLVLKVVDTATPSLSTGLAPESPHAASTPMAQPSVAPPTLSAAQLKPYVIAKQPFGDLVITLQQLVSHPLLQELDAALQHRLSTTLAALMPPDATPLDAAMLQEQVEKSGINYEAKVADLLRQQTLSSGQSALTQDLKGQLLELLAKLEHAASKSGELPELRQQVQQALQTIEFQQLTNLFAQQEHQLLSLQFMHPSFLASHTAQLYFRVEPHAAEAQPDEPQSYSVVFLLDLTALGQLRIDATVRQAHITATIRTTDEAVAAFLTTHTPALAIRLRELGLHAQVQCRAQEDVPLAVEDTFTRLLMAEPSHLLDITT